VHGNRVSLPRGLRQAGPQYGGPACRSTPGTKGGTAQCVGPSTFPRQSAKAGMGYCANVWRTATVMAVGADGQGLSP
jgi:hypothetical protein